MVEIIGKRLRLRPFTADDITDEYIGWLNDPAVTRFSNQQFREHSRESARAYLDSFEGTANLFYAIEDLESGETVGTLNAHRDVNHGVCDAGIVVGNRRFWGSRVGQEAWNMWVEWLLTEGGVRKLTAGCFETNRSARRMVEMAGMYIEGVRKDHQIFDGKPGDVVLYARFAN